MDHSHILWTNVKNGNTEAVQALFSRKLASPFDMDPTGSDALINLAWRDDPTMIELLLHEGADPNIPDRAGRTASHMLWTSALTGRLGAEGSSIVAGWLKDDDHADTMGMPAAHQLIVGPKQNIHGVGKWFSDAINTIDARGRTPLIWAILQDDAEKVRQVLDLGASTKIRDRRGKGPLHYVRSPKVLQLLLETHADVKLGSFYCQNTALHEVAIRHDSVEVIDALVQAGATLDATTCNGITPLFNAVSYGRTAVARRLRELSADPNVISKATGCSVLHEAILTNHHEILQPLLEHGANVNTVCLDGKGLGHQAARFASLKTLVAISSLGNWCPTDCTIMFKDKLGRTPNDYFRERVELMGIEPDVRAAWETFQGRPRYGMS